MAGAGYKLFNTGDVLTAAQVNTYLQEQAVMRFANAAARTTALSGVLAEGMMSYLDDTNSVEVYNGSAWVSVSSDQTPLTTKGDLFTYSTTDARLAVGNNGETLVADSSATTGLRWTATPSASNPVVNSSFQIWQRGTSGTANSFSAGAGYNADRWQNYYAGTLTVSRQNTNDTTNLPFIQYCARVQRNSGQTNTGQISHAQSLESINSIPYAGKTVTMSFYARAGANFSPTSNLLTATLATGTGTDQNVLFGFTGVNNSIASSVTLTTTWQRFTVTGTVPTNATQLATLFTNGPTGTAGANDWYEITGVQIDVGNTALPFRTSSATLAGELQAAQRYYYVHASGSTKTIGVGTYTQGSQVSTSVDFPVTMRTTPTLVIATGTDYYRIFRAGADDNFNDLVFEQGSTNACWLQTGSNVAGTAGDSGIVFTINASASIAFNSEL